MKAARNKIEEVGAGVQSVERALELLEILAQSGKWMGISELATISGQPIGTVHRLLQTLVARRYVTRNGRTRRYALGPAAHALAGAELQTPDWPTIATPFLRELVEVMGKQPTSPSWSVTALSMSRRRNPRAWYGCSQRSATGPPCTAPVAERSCWPISRKHPSPPSSPRPACPPAPAEPLPIPNSYAAS